MDIQTTYSSITKFDQTWWKEFEIETENFSKHNLFKSVFSEEEVSHLNYLVEDIIKKVVSDKKRQSYLRIWKNGTYDNLKTKFFNENPINDNESILEWKTRTFGDDKFGLFLNNANSHSEALSDLLLNYLHPYFECYGLPMNGFSTTIILGDYGWTPLGIHRDNLGEHIIHFHLGPGSKDIYIWNDDKSKKHGYVDFQKTENFEDFINDYSYKSSFEQGDVFSMLGKNVHIGNTHEFSVGLVIEFNGFTEKEFLKKIWFKLGEDLFYKNFKGDKAKILPSYTEKNHTDYLNFFNKEIRHHNIKTSQSLKNALKQKFLDHKYTLLSNNGFLSPPYVDLKNTKERYRKMNLNASIKKNDPYDILFYKKNNEINLFIRGVKFKTQNTSRIIPFIHKLNEGHSISMQEIKAHFFTDWNDSAIFKLLYILYKRKGIKIKFRE